MKYRVSTLNQLCILFLTSILFACGGSGGGSSSSSSSDANSNLAAEAAEPTHLSGSAIKGVISNGVVQAFEITNGSIGKLLVSSTTDASGNYSLTIPAGYNGPVYVLISAASDNSSLMTCDSAVGCGSYEAESELDINSNSMIDFGEQFPLPADFELSALVPSILAENNRLHADVTVITHLAAAYAETFPQGFDNLSAELAITQIANIFTISQNPFNLDVPSINDLSEFTDANSDEKTYALIASSLAYLANNESLTAALQNLTTSFSLNSGQLVNQSNDDADLTFATILNAAISNLNQINNDPENQELSALSTQLNTLLSAANSAPDNSLTTGEASPTAGSNELAKVEQFISDLEAWQGVIPVTSNSNTTIDDGTFIANSLTVYQSPLLQAFALASQHSAIVAVSDLALEAACDGMGNIFMTLLCQTLIAERSIEDICEIALDLTIFGVSLCEFLNDLTLPVGHGLWVNYAIYDRNARVFGSLEGVEMDVSFTNSKRTNNTIRFTINGSISDDDSEITFESSTVTFRFNSALTKDTIRLPDSVDISLNAESTSDTESDTVSFEGNIRTDADLDAITGNNQTGNNGISISTNFNGSFDINNTQQYDGKISVNNASTPYFTANLNETAADNSTNGTLRFSSPNQLGEENALPDSFRLSWNGRVYEFEFSEEDDSAINISNQDGVELDLNLDAEDEALAGTIKIGDADYASISFLNGSIVITLPNNSATVLYE